MSAQKPRQVIAIIGGATAGAEAAGMLAERGIVAVVFEQNARPYGKIEDGLPRWHVKLRQKEYEVIDGRLDRSDVHFVPKTKIGHDIAFHELATAWGFAAVLLANGAWRDRALPVDGADRYVDRGLVYQNSFIHWFNHYEEPGYDGPAYEISDGSLVVGGGLASIDVAKVLQVEAVRLALQRRGIGEEMMHIEHAGIPAVLQAHGLEWPALGLKPAVIIYRRRIEDMPLADVADGADEERRAKVEMVRRRIVDKATQKYLFEVRPLRVPVGLLTEEDRLVGLRLQHTKVEGSRAVPAPDAFEEMRAPMVISSIGSIPEPIKGIEQDGVLYRFVDEELGRLEGYENVFASGNVVTGKGNITASRKHSVLVSSHLIERFLGLDGESHSGEEDLLDPLTAEAGARAAKVADWVQDRPPLPAAQVEALLQRVRARQEAVGYGGSYREWIRCASPISAS